MNENTNKWLKTGLVDKDLPELDQTIVANNLEEAVQELLKYTEEPENIREQKACMFLPLIVRLFNEKNLRVIDSMSDLYKTFNEFYDINWTTFKNLETIHAVSGEAEFCSSFVEHFDEL
jgi:hypothetical protein